MTGEIGLSLLDFGARRLAGFADDQLFGAVPFHPMIGIIRALDQGVGGRKAEKPETGERHIEEPGRATPEPLR